MREDLIDIHDTRPDREDDREGYYGPPLPALPVPVPAPIGACGSTGHVRPPRSVSPLLSFYHSRSRFCYHV